MSGGREWVFWGVVGLLAVGHFALHLGLGVGANAPDLLTVAVLLSARRLRGSAAAAFGLGLGVLQDALSLFAFGANAVSFTALGYLGARSRDLFFGDSLLFIAGYLFVGTWLHDVFYYLLADSVGRVDAMTRLLVDAPVAALYSAAVGTVAYLIYRVASPARYSS